jgi:dipeptidyl aminopeptidase/acylaminoacyl peptidase
VVDQDGAAPRRITSGPAADVDPSRSPDGSRIAFASDRAGNVDIWTIDAAGETAPVRLTSSVGSDEMPAWSPDGPKIAFVSVRDGNREVYETDASGAGQRRLTFSPGTDRHPAWSGNGQRLAFDSDRSGNFEVYTPAADGSDVRQITAHPALDARPAWSPDGRYIVFQSERGASGRRDIYRIETSGGAVERDVWGYQNWATSPDWQRMPVLDNDPCVLRGTIYDDRIDVYRTSTGPETICGLAGNDYIDGGRGNDILHGGPGADVLIANDETAIGCSGRLETTDSLSTTLPRAATSSTAAPVATRLKPIAVTGSCESKGSADAVRTERPNSAEAKASRLAVTSSLAPPRVVSSQATAARSKWDLVRSQPRPLQ